MSNLHYGDRAKATVSDIQSRICFLVKDVYMLMDSANKAGLERANTG